MNDQNNQTQHNHPPRCCCHYSAEAITADDVTVCPMCTEHGELARLAEWKPEYPGQPEPQYPCCHQTIGRPHTDYCLNSLPSSGEGLEDPAADRRDQWAELTRDALTNTLDGVLPGNVSAVDRDRAVDAVLDLIEGDPTDDLTGIRRPDSP